MSSKDKKTVVKHIIAYLKNELGNHPNAIDLKIGSIHDEVLYHHNKDYVDVPLILQKELGHQQYLLDDIVDVCANYETYVEARLGMCNQDVCVWLRFLWVNPQESNIKTRKQLVHSKRSGGVSKLFVFGLLLIFVVAFWAMIRRWYGLSIIPGF